jgi:hypothetical protein
MWSTLCSSSSPYHHTTHTHPERGTGVSPRIVRCHRPLAALIFGVCVALLYRDCGVSEDVLLRDAAGPQQRVIHLHTSHRDTAHTHETHEAPPFHTLPPHPSQRVPLPCACIDKVHSLSLLRAPSLHFI